MGGFVGVVLYVERIACLLDRLLAGGMALYVHFFAFHLPFPFFQLYIKSVVSVGVLFTPIPRL